MPEGALGLGAGRLRPPPRFATVYNLAHVERAGLARMATAGRPARAYTSGAPRPRLRCARHAT